MPTLEIFLLGHPRIVLDGLPYKTHSPRTVALLAYLALAPKPCPRQELIDQLWPFADDGQHSGTLRTSLWRLRDTPLGDWLEITDDSVALVSGRQAWLDVNEFEYLLGSSTACTHPASTACSNCLPNLTHAADLYTGDFMQGHHLKKAGKFTYWQTGQRDSLHEKVISIYKRLLDYHSQQGQFKKAIDYAQRCLEYDPADEDTHRLLMNLYANNGQRQAALDQYQRCVRAIARADDATPAMETSVLYNQIRGESAHVASLKPLLQPTLMLINLQNAVELWAQDHQNFHQKAERLLKITKRCARIHAGEVIKYDKDHVIVLFTRGLPLHFALDIHRQMAEEPWGGAFAPMLCISIYPIQQGTASNPAQPRLDASALQSLYTIAEAAWPGQVLVSGESAKALSLPRSAHLRDQGNHQFKSLDQPVHVWELIHPDLSENQGRPVRSLSQNYHNLPAQATHFVGREQDRQEIRRMLSQPDCRLLTLVGPGGIGKTRLAVQVAREVLQEYPDGVFYAALAAIKQAHHIPSTLAEALSLRYNTQQDSLTQVINYLKAKHCLLVIDNLEHLVQGSEIFSDLLSQVPGLKILATSRERLNLHAEAVVEVSGLPYPQAPFHPEEYEHLAAMQLFIQSAQRTSLGFHANAETMPSIGKICRLVNGMPLAIELAAAWVRTMSCAEIAAKIEQNLDFLVSSLRDIPSRHRNLRAVFEHSWSLLSEEERRVLARLSMFRGGFTAPVAERVTDASPLVLTALADKSMLQQIPSGRYDILDVLRHYAAEKLNQMPGEPDETLQRHGLEFAAQLRQMIFDLNTHLQKQAIETFQVEFENIRVAWKWALQHARWEALDQMQDAICLYHDIVGRFTEAQAIFASALQVLQDQALTPYHQGVLARLRMWQGLFAFRLGDQENGLGQMEQSLEIFRQTGMLWEHAYTLNHLAEAYMMLRRFDLARQRLEESQHLYPCSNPPATLQQAIHSGFTRYLQGGILLQQGYPTHAKPHLEKALETVQTLGNQWASMRVLALLARVWAALQNNEECLRIRLRVLEIYKELGDRRGMAASLNNLSAVYESMGEPEQATQVLNQALVISREIGDRRLTGVILLNLADDHRVIYHTPAEAVPLAQEALQIFQEMGDESGTVYAGYDLAGAYLDAGQITQAYGMYCKALHDATETQSLSLQLHVLHGFALYYARINHLTQAIGLCTMILAHPASEADTRERVANLLSTLEDRLPTKESTAARQAGRLLSLDSALIQALLARSTPQESFLASNENAFGI